MDRHILAHLKALSVEGIMKENLTTVYSKRLYKVYFHIQFLDIPASLTWVLPLLPEYDPMIGSRKARFEDVFHYMP